MGGVNTAAAVEAQRNIVGGRSLPLVRNFCLLRTLGDRVSIGVDKLSEGRSVTQANIVNRVGDRDCARMRHWEIERFLRTCNSFRHPMFLSQRTATPPRLTTRHKRPWVDHRKAGLC